MVEKQVKMVKCVLSCRRGAAMVEYALLAALIAIVAVTALKSIGTNISSRFNTVSTSV